MMRGQTVLFKFFHFMRFANILSEAERRQYVCKSYLNLLPMALHIYHKSAISDAFTYHLSLFAKPCFVAEDYCAV